MKKIIMLLFLVFSTFTTIAVAAEVKNLKVGQSGDKAMATFDLVGVGGEQEAEVTVAIIIDGVRRTAESLKFSGDFGNGVKVGPGKKIIWDAKADLPTNFDGDLTWDVQAVVINKPKAALHKAFPKLPVESILETDIKGLFEVVSGQNVFYYYPEKEYLFVGEIITTKGKNLTAEKKGEIAAKLVKNLPLDKAVKIGNGKTAVIEFTDPDCPYCRKASEFFKNRTDVTRYVFFSPIAHPAAITKVYYILNASDKAKAYQEMFDGKDAVPPEDGYSESIETLAREHIELARSAGVTGTPTFFINGKQVVGADMPQIEKLLNDPAQTGR